MIHICMASTAPFTAASLGDPTLQESEQHRPEIERIDGLGLEQQMVRFGNFRNHLSNF